MEAKENHLYDDLPEQDLGSEIIKLQECNSQLHEHIRSLENDVSRLCTVITEMKKVQKHLETNISVLFKTAKLEIERKNRTIANLQSELDNLLFKRNNRMNYHKETNHKQNTMNLEPYSKNCHDRSKSKSPLVDKEKKHKANSVWSESPRSQRSHESSRSRHPEREKNRQYLKRKREVSYEDKYRYRRSRSQSKKRDLRYSGKDAKNSHRSMKKEIFEGDSSNVEKKRSSEKELRETRHKTCIGLESSTSKNDCVQEAIVSIDSTKTQNTKSTNNGKVTLNGMKDEVLDRNKTAETTDQTDTNSIIKTKSVDCASNQTIGTVNVTERKTPVIQRRRRCVITLTN